MVGITAARLGITIENNSKAEFRYTLGADIPTRTHGFRLPPGQSRSIDQVVVYEKKDATSDFFTGPITAIVISGNEGHLDFCEIVSV